MFINNSNTLVHEANNGAAMLSPDGGPYKGSQELTPRLCMSLDDLDVLTEISIGETSITYLVKHKISGDLYALRVAPKVGLSDVDVKYILEQQTVHVAIAKTAGNFLLPLIASWHDERNFYIVTDYIRGGDLATEVTRCGSLGAARARCYIAELVLGVESLHKLNIVHRGVTMNNILIDSMGHIILGEYGFSRRFDEPGSGALTADVSFMDFVVDPDCDEGSFLKFPATTATACDVTGIPYAMSPEQHRGLEYSYDADIWAMGVMLYLMLIGTLPFGNDSENMEEMVHQIAHAPLMVPEDGDIDPVTADLLSGLLAKDRRDRLTIPEIKAHEYFKDIDWFKVASKTYLVPWRPLISSLPELSQDISPPMAGVPFPVSADPYPEFQFLAAHVAPVQAAKLDVSPPLIAPRDSMEIMEHLVDRPSAVAAIPAAPGSVPASSESPSCGPARSLAPASRKGGLRPLILPKILARRTLEAQSRNASSHMYLSPIVDSPTAPSSAGSSPRESLFTAISRSTTPTTISSRSPSPPPGSGFSDAPKETDCAGWFPPPAPVPTRLTPICPVALSAGLRLRVASAAPKSQGLGIFNFTPAPLSRGPVLQTTRHKRSAALVPAPIPQVLQVRPRASPTPTSTKVRRTATAGEPMALVPAAEPFERDSAAAGQAPREIALGMEAPHENVIARTRARLWRAQDEAWGIPAIEVDRICLGSAWSADTIPDLAAEEEENEQEAAEMGSKSVGRAVWEWAAGLWARRALRTAA